MLLRDLVDNLGLDPLTFLTVIISTTVLYFVFVLVLAQAGQRLLASAASLELAVVTVLGAVIGRSLLGPVPTLAGGLLALLTLFALEWVSGRVRRTASRRRGDNQHRAVALVVAGKADHALLTRHQIDDAVLWSVLRGAGVRSLAEVALVVLERGGQWSVLRAGEEVHPAALAGVRHANEVLARLRAAVD